MASPELVSSAEPGLGRELQRWAAASGIDCCTPEHPEYATKRLVYNRIHDAYPVAVVSPRSAAEVAQCLRFARAQALPLAVRGGGHHVGGFGTCDAGLVIDLGSMRRVAIGNEGVASVGAGARLGHVDGFLCPRGFVVPTGTVSDTGIAGLALGGGIGWLLGLYGLTCDNLVGADVVVGDGELVRAEAPEHGELLWALRGGGGGLGIVTEFRFRTHRLPICVAGSLVVQAAGARAALWRLVQFLEERCPARLTVAPVLRQDSDGRLALFVDFCLAGSDERALDRLIDVVAPARQEVRRRADFSEWQRALDAAFEVPLRGFWKCCYVPALTQSQVDHVVDAAERLPTPQSSILIEHLHGAFGDTTEDTSAFPLRHARFGVLFSSRWRERELDAHCMGWARGGVANCDPAETAGAYSNYSFDGEARVARDLGRARIGSRLLRAKASYDPNNLLRLNHLGRSLASAVQR